MRKHLLILLALVAALSLVFVACDKTPEQPLTPPSPPMLPPRSPPTLPPSPSPRT